MSPRKMSLPPDLMRSRIIESLGLGAEPSEAATGRDPWRSSWLGRMGVSFSVDGAGWSRCDESKASCSRSRGFSIRHCPCSWNVASSRSLCPQHPGCFGEILLKIAREWPLLQATGRTENSDSSHPVTQSDQPPVA